LAATGDRERRKRRREGLIVVLTCLLVVVLTVLETQVFNVVMDLSAAGSVVVFALINLNAVLLLLLVFLVLRNLVKLIFERRRGAMGSRLRTRLVAAFVALSILPTVLLFFAAAKFVTTSIDYWFDSRVERSLAESVEIGRSYYADLAEQALAFCRQIRDDLEASGLSSGEDLAQRLEASREEFHLGAVTLFWPDQKRLAEAKGEPLAGVELPAPPADVARRAAATDSGLTQIQALSTGELVRALLPAGGGRLLVADYYLPEGLVRRLDDVREGFESYRQLQMVKNPIKLSYLITLSVLTLLMIFAATWFGFYLAKGITGPLQKLAEGTERISHGDLDFSLETEAADEMGILVDSFNRMTAELKASQKRLEEAMEELRRRNAEIEDKRRYTEAVLGKVAAGVVSMDRQGRIGTMNSSAAALLALDPAVCFGKAALRVLPGELARLLEAGREEGGTQVRLEVAGRTLSLLVHVSQLGEGGQGTVMVFEDLTQLEKAQRMAAWREVARRIAHEIKNPLTPIQLSAQRLRRRYLASFQKGAGGGEIFEECTRMIIDQVEELKRLVNEFSSFARLPQANPAPTDLVALVSDTLVLYEQAHKGIAFGFRQEGEFPTLNLDREQMKRVLINLLDNAVDCLQGHGEVCVELSFDPILRMARIEVQDSGPGIDPADKLRLFEPYFSTKKTGTGLGLAICSAIIADHNGFIRVRDNDPRGSRFIVELPVG
jgi:two-component system nitrogen regulation sensor histidine kinase NtrY